MDERTEGRTDGRTYGRTWVTLNALPHSTNGGGITTKEYQLRHETPTLKTFSKNYSKTTA